MAQNKSSEFSKKNNEIAGLAKAMAHPARIAIVEYLLSVEACICGDIVNELPLAQATVSEHLKKLKESGLIKGNVEGTAVCYCLDKEKIQSLHVYFQHLYLEIAKQQNSCCDPES